jgi:hypothetical protein
MTADVQLSVRHGVLGGMSSILDHLTGLAQVFLD